jgi:hypothetical protein
MIREQELNLVLAMVRTATVEPRKRVVVIRALNLIIQVAPKAV